MQITIESEFEIDDICLAEISFYIFKKIKTPEGETIKKEVLHSKVKTLYCELRRNQFNAMRYYTGTNKKDIVSIHIKCIKTIGSKAIR